MVFIALIIIISAGVFLLLAMVRKEGQKIDFWQSFLCSISNKIINHYFSTSSARIALYTIRGITALGSASLFGLPALEIVLNRTSNKNYWQLILKWDNVDTIVSIVSIISLVLVAAIFFLTHKVDAKKIEDSQKQIQRAIAISEEKNDNRHEELKKLIQNLSPENKVIIINLIHSIKEQIDSLKLKTAYDLLLRLEEEAEKFCPDNNQLISQLEHSKGSCSKYIDHLRAEKEFEKAYKYSQLTGVIDVNASEGYIFALCARHKENEALQIAETLRANAIDNVWSYIPDFILTTDKKQFYDNLRNVNQDLADSLIGEMILLSQIREEDFHVSDFETIERDDLLLTYKTLPLWILQLAQAIATFWRTPSIRFFEKDLKTTESEKLFGLTDRFIKLIEDSEIRPLLPDIELYHSVAGYLRDRSNYWIEKVKQLPSRNHSLKPLLLSFLLYDSGKVEEAIFTLKEWKDRPLEGDIQLLKYAMLSHNWEDVTVQLNRLSEGPIPEDGYYWMLNLGRYHSEKYYALLKQMKLLTEEQTSLFHAFIDFFNGDDSSVQLILSKYPNSHRAFAPFYPLVYQKQGDYETAIAITQNLLSPGVHDQASEMYMNLLETSHKNDELYQYLQDLRKRGNDDIPLLIKELNLAEQLDDYEAGENLSKKLYDLLPDNSNVIFHRLLNLYKSRNNTDEIIGLFDKLHTVRFDYNQIRNIVNVYILIGKIDLAIEFLYQQICKSTDQRLKDLFFQVHIQPGAAEIIDKEHDIVAEGDIIQFKSGKQRFEEKITIGSIYEDFIGKRRGDEMTVNLGSKTQRLIIKHIHNPYYGVMKQVSKDIQNNKSKSFRTVNIKDFGDNIIDSLKALVASFVCKENLDLDNKYKNHGISLYSFVANNDIGQLYDFIFGEKYKYQFPFPILEMRHKISNLKGSDRDVVLDLSSLILIHRILGDDADELSCHLHISKGTYSHLQQAYDRECYCMPSGLSSYASQNLFDEGVKKRDRNIANIIKDLLSWIDSYCKVDYIPQKLNIEDYGKDDLLRDIQFDSLLLALDKGWILVSEDAYLNEITAYSIINCEAALALFYDELKIGMIDFLNSCHFVGCLISPQYISCQYDRMAHNKLNNFDYCLESIGYNPFALKNVIIASVFIWDGLYTTAKKRAVTNMLTLILKQYNYQAAEKIFTLVQQLIRDPLLLECYIDALRIINPVFDSKVSSI